MLSVHTGCYHFISLSLLLLLLAILSRACHLTQHSQFSIPQTVAGGASLVNICVYLFVFDVRDFKCLVNAGSPTAVRLHAVALNPSFACTAGDSLCDLIFEK